MGGYIVWCLIVAYYAVFAVAATSFILFCIEDAARREDRSKAKRKGASE